MNERIPEHPKHHLGQNFLIDRNIIEKIIEFVHPAPADRFLEIGAGTGIFTQELASLVAIVYAVELDASLIPALQKISGIQVLHADILTLDLCALVSAGPALRVIGNLPYYISTAILSNLLKQKECLQDLTLMFQEEVAMRILSPPSRSEYGLISVLSQYFCEIQKGFRISKHCFSPRPKVESRILRFRFRPGRAVSYQEYHAFLVKAFSQRRKKLRNNLIHAIPVPAERIDAAFRRLGISELARAENLTPETYEKLILDLQEK